MEKTSVVKETPKEVKPKFTPFITTFTGRKVNPLNLKVEDISVRDIAHHLAILNRFVGALKEPVSIAQHSVHVCRLMKETQWQREALMHDATEAYLGDVSKWVKQTDAMKAYRDAEDKVWLVICEALHIDPEITPEKNGKLKEADDLMVRYEAMRCLKNPEFLFELPSHPRPIAAEIQRVGQWRPWSWQESETCFLRLAHSLGFTI